VGYLGLFDEEGTYVVPLNFVWLDEKIYFHGSEQGRKIDAIQKDHRVCFSISQDFGRGPAGHFNSDNAFNDTGLKNAELTRKAVHQPKSNR
jgi:nitroimidazol reductase NimA-like FMN-containing flavoprotein (pyridoxamine 5'-phosphate oxidase superfamily)